jgi:hypothetical protein
VNAGHTRISGGGFDFAKGGTNAADRFSSSGASAESDNPDVPDSGWLRMMLRNTKRWLLGLAALAASPGLRAADDWQQPEHLRGSNVRVFSSDGTLPGVGKGPVAKPKVKEAEKPKREADLTPPPVSYQVPVIAPAPAITPVPVQPAALVSPIQRLSNVPWPKMPHGYQDPTHPVGPAEPGSAARTRFGPVSSGHVLKRR